MVGAEKFYIQCVLIETVNGEISKLEFFTRREDAHDEMCKRMAGVCEVSVQEIKEAYLNGEPLNGDDDTVILEDMAYTYRDDESYEWKIVSENIVLGNTKHPVEENDKPIKGLREIRDGDFYFDADSPSESASGDLSFTMRFVATADEIFGLNVETTDNGNWIEVYAIIDNRYEMVEDNLTVTLNKDDGSVENYSYCLSEKEKAVILARALRKRQAEIQEQLKGIEKDFGDTKRGADSDNRIEAIITLKADDCGWTEDEIRQMLCQMNLSAHEEVEFFRLENEYLIAGGFIRMDVLERINFRTDPESDFAEEVKTVMDDLSKENKDKLYSFNGVKTKMYI